MKTPKTETELLRCDDCAPEFACWSNGMARCRKKAEHPRRIAKIAHLPADKLAHESEEVQRLCTEFREKSVRAVCRFMDLTGRMARLTDRELAALVVEQVWGTCVRLGSEEECLLDEMITRFEAKSGIERDEEGRVLPASHTPPPPPLKHPLRAKIYPR